jgi:hypothetical protein
MARIHAGVDLIHEFLTIAGVALGGHANVGGVIKCADGGFRGVGSSTLVSN